MNGPKLRSLEAFSVKDNLICLRDPLSFSDKLLLIPPNIFFICTLLDGKHSIIDIQEKYTRMYGDLLFSNKVQEIIEQLDNCLFLENEHFEKAKEKAITEFKLSQIRSATHAGSAYENERDSLLKQLESLFSQPAGPGIPQPESPSGRLKGIIAPHIDLKRGGSCFAWSYGEVAKESNAHTFVILGISHTDTQRRFVFTTKDFETPLGRLETDKDFIESLSKRCSSDFFMDEFVHRNEHSIEFQVLFLQYLFSELRDIRIVPILCSSFNHLMYTEGSPIKEKEVSEFIAALKAVIEERDNDVCCIAGVDLSHVGQRFGQKITVSPALINDVEREDRRMLEYVLNRDAEGFFQFIQNEKDRRNVCGVPAIYTLLHVIKAAGARLLKYEKAVDHNTQSIISFAGVALYD
ncbi:hypothetical protein ES703_85068 [subsurface metagenome]